MVNLRIYLELESNFHTMSNYNTISEALADLNKRGYTIDYNLGFAGIQTHKYPVSLAGDKFEITEVYRFEGQTDPDDQAVVYAIESRNGHKGILVNGYGISADSANDKMIEELRIRRTRVSPLIEESLLSQSESSPINALTSNLSPSTSGHRLGFSHAITEQHL